jgi:hypothetical protein
MKKDIPQLKVEDLAFAIVPSAQRHESDDNLWDVYILNLKEEPIKDVFINSRGYGEINGEMRRTTVLRHFFETIPALQIVKLEPIQEKVFSLTNEYWVSFRYNGYMYDKCYMFVPGSIDEIHFTIIPFLGEKGVMIR